MSTVNNPRFGNPGNAGRSEGHQNAGQHGSGNSGQGGGAGIMESVKEGAETIASSVSSAAGQAWDTTREGAQQVAHYAETAWDSTNDFMRRYPLVTLGIGMCMGFSLCLALQPRRA
jgi:ElaB/YqjD/DUF883 family membrane-anchored ribosome-binding protein